MGFFYAKLLIALFILIDVKANAQRDTTLRLGIECSPSLSYTGFNQSFAFLIKKRKNSLYLGPKVSLSNYYLPLYSLWGINGGIRHNFVNAGRVNCYFNIDYQNTLYRTNRATDKVKFNSIHEFNFSYGINYNFFKKFHIGNSIGFGRYLEFYHDTVENRKVIYQGYGNLFKLFIQYEF
ncbi:MAG: hypothetical protein M3Q58_14350 [Bacteroidota bacterium]|nr:hypothetical protein [Bacteroidota bacterium]